MVDHYPYPSDLDSDDEGSAQYDWDDDDDDDDDQFWGNGANSRPSSRASSRASQRAPPQGHSGYSASNGSNFLCVVCNARPQFNKNGRRYPTCGLTCASKLPNTPPGGGSAFAGGNQRQNTSSRRQHNFQGNMHPSYHVRGGSSANWGPPAPRPHCVICKTKPSSSGYVTCGFACAEKLCKDGGDLNMCDYCHRRPRVTGKQQCGLTCGEKAKVACLLCKCRPKNGKYHLCGKTCKRISTKSTPLILEAPKGHVTFEMVEKKFKSGWKNGIVPEIKKVFKIIENDAFLHPYEAYRKNVGNEHFRYHGTRRQCQLGTTTTTVCASTACPVCSILRSSFKVALANPAGSFGQGVYSSSASSMSYAFSGQAGAILLTKVVLGKIMDAKNAPGVKACPPGHNSVEHDAGGASNETIVYSDDAIRPVFLITF